VAGLRAVDKRRWCTTVEVVSPFSPLLVIAAVAAAVSSYRWRAHPARRSWALAAVTVGFWWVFDPLSAAVLVATTAAASAAARSIDAQQRNTPGRVWRRRVAVVGTVSAMAAVRFTPAVVDWFVEHGLVAQPLDRWWQPLGVAVMALQVVCYLVDVDRGETRPAAFGETMLIIGFFPRAFAGPIVRPGAFLAQLRAPWAGTVPLGEVAQRVMSAVFKRYVLAETLIRYDAATTGANAELGRIDAVLHLMVGPLRFFVDISALTDLAIAVGLCCGLRLPENFKDPFRATSIGGLFRAWHLSISGFFRDYVLVNLLPAKAAKSRVVGAAVATMAIIGAWHHPTPGAVLWGLAMGVPIGVEIARRSRTWRPRNERMSSKRPVWRVGLQRAGVFGFVALISPLYNGSTLATAGRAWAALGNDWFATTMFTPGLVLCAVVSYLLGAGRFASAARATQAGLDRLPSWAVGATTAITVTVCAGLAGAGVPDFLYQRL
jgi:alginate O-acetyltransferase complex protein AlgI